jgi:transposase
MDETGQCPHMKGHYLVMDNAPIHTSVDIAKYVESCGYRCVYFPLYSPELNPIEQFWSVVKSKVKRNKFLEKESLMTRIRGACYSLYLSDFASFVSHSAKCFDKCLSKERL